MKDKKPFEQGPIDGLTPELMEGYAKGSLSPEMMAKIKHYLEENPFEAEAMEGLIANPVEFVKDIQDLEGRLKHKIIFENSNNRKVYWPAAAVVALLILSGLVFYFFIPDSTESSELAVNEDKMEERSQPQPEAAITPSNPKAEKIPQNPTIKLEDNEATSHKEVKQSSTEEKIESASEEVLVEEVKPNENSQGLIFEPVNPEKDANTAIVSSIEVQPLTKPESVSDTSLPRSPPQSSFSADGKPQAAAQSKAKRSTDPAAGLEIARDSQEDVVFPEAQTPTYIKGYLKEHLIYPEEAKANEITGKVIIVFIVHEDGALGNFEFLQKLGYGCDEEAIRALKQGPSWKPADINGMSVKSRGQIEIVFPQSK